MLFRHLWTINCRNIWQLSLPVILFICLSLIFAVSNTTFNIMVPFVLALISYAGGIFSVYNQQNYLQFLKLQHISMLQIAIIQFVINWLFVVLPLLIVTGLYQHQFPLEMLFVGTALQALLMIIGALLISSKVSGFATILVIPLALPVIIFGSLDNGFQYLVIVTTLYLALFPWLTAAMLSESIRYS